MFCMAKPHERYRFPFAPVEDLLLRRYGLDFEFPASEKSRNSAPAAVRDPDGTRRYTAGAIGRFLEGADPKRDGCIRPAVITRWRTKGMSVAEADSVAVRLGWPAVSIWPDFYDDVLDAPDQGELFFLVAS